MFSNNDYIYFASNQKEFVFNCNYDKAKINRNIILNHIQKIRNNIDCDNLQYAINIGKTTSKDIILKRPYLLLSDSHKIYESCLFLQGKSSSEIFNDTLNDKDNLNIEYPTKSKNRREKIISIFPDIKITNISSDKQNLIFERFTRFFHILNLKNICTFTAQITKAIYLAYNNNNSEDLSTTKEFVENLGYNTSNFFSGNNIFSVFNKNNLISNDKELNLKNTENITENIRVLKDYLQPQAIQQIILNNFNILIKDTQTIKDILKNIEDKSEENLLNEFITNKANETSQNSLQDIIKYTKIKHCKNVNYSKDGPAKLLFQIRSGNYNTSKSQLLKINKSLNALEYDLYGDEEEITKEKIDNTNKDIDATIKSLETKKQHLSKLLADLEKESLWYHKYNRNHDKNFELKDNEYLSIQQELDKQIANSDCEYSEISSQLGDIKECEILKFLKARKTIKYKDSMIANIKVELSAIDMIIDNLTLLKDSPINKEVTKNLRFITNLLDSFIEVIETSGGIQKNQEKAKRVWAGICHANENIKKLTGVDFLATRGLCDIPDEKNPFLNLGE